MSKPGPSKPLAEESVPHTRMMKCTLEVEPSRAYWAECGMIGKPISTQHAFERAIFGSKTYSRVARLIADMRHRYDAFPSTLPVLGHWLGIDPADRVLICHWHTQLADPLYRRFTGELLVDRHRDGPRPTVDRTMATEWLDAQVPGRWQFPTRSMIASKMMTSALTAGMLTSNRDPRTIRFPRVSDTALAYLMYLLREVHFDGTLISNPYVASVGFDTDTISRRLRKIPALGFHRQGELIDFQWQHDTMEQWAEATGLLSTVGSERGGK